MQPAKSRFKQRYDAAKVADDTKVVAELDRSTANGYRRVR
jgi:hypothetical protein